MTLGHGTFDELVLLTCNIRNILSHFIGLVDLCDLHREGIVPLSREELDSPMQPPHVLCH